MRLSGNLTSFIYPTGLLTPLTGHTHWRRRQVHSVYSVYSATTYTSKYLTISIGTEMLNTDGNNLRTDLATR